jgi:hypothetical protein
MNEEITHWQLVTSANPTSALLPGSLSLFCGKTAFVYAPGEFTQQMLPALFVPNGTPGKDLGAKLCGPLHNINLPRKNRKILHYFCRLPYYLA